MADAADALERERMGMPAELKAPKSAEEIQMLRDMYDEYNAAMGNPTQ